MRPKLQVLVNKSSGVPFAQVPAEAMWDLVEYLSWQRVLATYDFAATHFTVAFPHLDVDSTQRLLDEWRTTSDHAESGSPHMEAPADIHAYAVSH